MLFEIFRNSSVCMLLRSCKLNRTIKSNLTLTITQKMAGQGRSDFDVVFTMILCATNFFIW